MHLTRDILNRLIDGEISGGDERRVRAHLAGCQACEGALEVAEAMRQLTREALLASAADVSFVEIESDKGHDAFLLEEPEFWDTLRGFLFGCGEQLGLTAP